MPRRGKLPTSPSMTIVCVREEPDEQIVCVVDVEIVMLTPAKSIVVRPSNRDEQANERVIEHMSENVITKSSLYSGSRGCDTDFLCHLPIE